MITGNISLTVSDRTIRTFNTLLKMVYFISLNCSSDITLFDFPTYQVAIMIVIQRMAEFVKINNSFWLQTIKKKKDIF